MIIDIFIAMRLTPRKITILIAGVVFAMELIIGLGGYVFAAENYNSSRSNTSTSIATVDQKVGDILLRYGAGGVEINKVTDALAIGISKVDLKATLIEIGINEEGVQEVFTELDRLGVGDTSLSAPATGVDPGAGQIEEGTVSTPVTGETPQSAAYIKFDGVKGETDGAIEVNPLKKFGEVSVPNVEDTQKSAPVLDEAAVIGEENAASFFDVFTNVDLESFIEVIASDANITKTEAGRVIDALMAVSPPFRIDENGLQKSIYAELVEAIVSGANLSKADARRALDAFVGTTTKSLRESNRVALVGFGSFSISKRKARTGRNPQTGAILQIPAKKVVRFKAGADLAKTVTGIKLQNEEFHDAQMSIIRNIRAATPEERKNLIDKLRTSRDTFQTEIVSMNLKIRENAQKLRDSFQKRFEQMEVTGYCAKCKERKGRIALAHGKGLWMLNRFRSATARFSNILSRLESRVQKLEAQGIPADSFFDVFTSIEEAKNMSIENEEKLGELKAKYEFLLLGENVKGIAKEARAVAKELKIEIENLHAKLREIAGDIRQANKDYNSSISNSSTSL